LARFLLPRFLPLPGLLPPPPKSNDSAHAPLTATFARALPHLLPRPSAPPRGGPPPTPPFGPYPLTPLRPLRNSHSLELRHFERLTVVAFCSLVAFFVTGCLVLGGDNGRVFLALVPATELLQLSPLAFFSRASPRERSLFLCPASTLIAPSSADRVSPSPSSPLRPMVRSTF